MKGKEKRKLAIQELVLSGFTQEKIAAKLGISISTVSRTVKKYREQSDQWLVNLAQKDMANIYRQSLDGLQHDLMNLNELLEDDTVKKNVKLQLQIHREIVNIRSKYLQYLLQGPMVWSMSQFVKNNTIGAISEPKMESLGGISGVN